MVSVSWGSKGEINATRPSPLPSQAGRKGMGMGRGGQWGGGYEDMEKSRGKLVRSLRLLHTHVCLPAHKRIG